MEHISQRLNANKFNDAFQKENPLPVIRKLETGDWYWINRNVLKIHANSLGSSGIAVYNVLASFANARTQSCFPAHRTIGKIARLSKRTVGQKMQQLELLGLIRRHRQKKGSVCYLLDVRRAAKLTSTSEEKSLTGEKNDP